MLEEMKEYLLQSVSIKDDKAEWKAISYNYVDRLVIQHTIYSSKIPPVQINNKYRYRIKKISQTLVTELELIGSQLHHPWKLLGKSSISGPVPGLVSVEEFYWNHALLSLAKTVATCYWHNSC